MRFLNRIQQQQGSVFYDWEHIIPVNKSPHLMNKIGYAHELFPKSKFILIIRDIYGYSSSMKIHLEEYSENTGKVYIKTNDDKDCWFRINPEEVSQFKSYPPDFEVIPEMWMRLNSLAIDEIRQIPENQYMIIHYENLISNQKQVLKQVFDFLELLPDHERSVEKIVEQTSSFKNTTTRGNPLNKWDRYLSKAEKDIIRSVISENRSKYDFIQMAG